MSLTKRHIDSLTQAEQDEIFGVHNPAEEEEYQAAVVDSILALERLAWQRNIPEFNEDGFVLHDLADMDA